MAGIVYPYTGYQTEENATNYWYHKIADQFGEDYGAISCGEFTGNNGTTTISDLLFTPKISIITGPRLDGTTNNCGADQLYQNIDIKINDSTLRLRTMSEWCGECYNYGLTYATTANTQTYHSLTCANVSTDITVTSFGTKSVSYTNTRTDTVYNYIVIGSLNDILVPPYYYYQTSKDKTNFAQWWMRQFMKNLFEVGGNIEYISYTGNGTSQTLTTQFRPEMAFIGAPSASPLDLCYRLQANNTYKRSMVNWGGASATPRSWTNTAVLDNHTSYTVDVNATANHNKNASSTAYEMVSLGNNPLLGTQYLGLNQNLDFLFSQFLSSPFLRFYQGAYTGDGASSRELQKGNFDPYIGFFWGNNSSTTSDFAVAFADWSTTVLNGPQTAISCGAGTGNYSTEARGTFGVTSFTAETVSVNASLNASGVAYSYFILGK